MNIPQFFFFNYWDMKSMWWPKVNPAVGVAPIKSQTQSGLQHTRIVWV